MRGKVARELRKEVNFDPNEKREYYDMELTRVRKILSYDFEKKSASIVERPVSVFITECTDGARNFYKYLKRKWNNPNYEMALNQLPEVDELANLAKTIITDEEVVEDTKKTNKTINDLNGVSPQSNDAKSAEAEGE